MEQRMKFMYEKLGEKNTMTKKTAEIFACVDCGAVFLPGQGPDDIVEIDYQLYEAEREGDCPCCNSENPKMEFITELEKSVIIS